MIVEPWEELARARSFAGDELILRHRSGLFEIRCNGYELMSNRAHRSEEALARLALEELEAPAPRILVGGLGMGFTLRAALDAAPAEARVTVAELLPEIVAWNRGPLAALAGHPLADARVEVREGDVAVLLEAVECPYDAIIIDIDNGPEAILSEVNASLFSARSLRKMRRALAQDGVLAVWSAEPSSRFADLLDEARFSWRATEVTARGVVGDPRHVVYLARAAF
jgi:spermidine synthase